MVSFPSVGWRTERAKRGGRRKPPLFLCPRGPAAQPTPPTRTITPQGTILPQGHVPARIHPNPGPWGLANPIPHRKALCYICNTGLAPRSR
jgi:hypothetical protein